MCEQGAYVTQPSIGGGDSDDALPCLSWMEGLMHWSFPTLQATGCREGNWSISTHRQVGVCSAVCS